MPPHVAIQNGIVVLQLPAHGHHASSLPGRPLVNGLFPGKSETPQPVLGAHHLFGRVQLRTARVKPQPCRNGAVAGALQPQALLRWPTPGADPEAASCNTTREWCCFPEWLINQPETHDDAPFGDPAAPYRSVTFESTLKGSPIFTNTKGLGTQSFGSVGQEMLMNRTRSDFVQQLQRLERDFVDGGTRAVAVSFGLYNPNANVFTVGH